MAKIDNVEWGKIIVDGKAYAQIIVVGSKILERDREVLKRMFGTTHKIGDWEKKLLLSENPKHIVIGTGFRGVLEVEESLRKTIEEGGIDLYIGLTPAAIKEYNRLAKTEKSINALIHTTC